MSTRLTTAQFADLVGISERKARQAFTRALQGKRWRGTQLVIEALSGRGGGAGQSYAVRVVSLPAVFQERLKEHFSIVERPVFQATDDLSSNKHNWMMLVLAPAMAFPPHSRDRRAKIEEIAAQRHIDWSKQPRVLSTRTIERWLERSDKMGAAAFVRRSRKDKAVKRVAVSAAWDAAVDLDPIERSQVADEVRSFIRGLIVKDASRAVTGMLAAAHLRELTIGASSAAHSLPIETFAIPRRFIDQELRYRKVAIFDRNRKAREDSKPRIIRQRDGLMPQEIIVGDVHHLDIVMRRPDGSEAWPKAIAWLDLATNRIWLDLVMLEKGEGIRNSDVIKSFIRMVSTWGMCQTLYLDNGSEYRWAEFVNDALKLVSDIRYNSDSRSSHIIRAKPYNAPAKAIEGIFGVLEQTYFRTLPGWAGGDRTNKRTHQVGKPTEPFPGTINDLAQAIGGLLRLYEIKPQIGSLNKRSPQQALEAAIANGWQAIMADYRELHVIFATDETRKPRQGYINFDGDKWTCRELQAFQGDRITVRIPKFEGPHVLPLIDPMTNRIVGYATRAERYGILDKAGAKAAAQMDRASRDGVRQLRESAQNIDPNREIARLVSTLPASLPAPIGGTIGISDQAAEIAKGIAETPAQRRDRAQSEAEREHRSRLAIIENALKKSGKNAG